MASAARAADEFSSPPRSGCAPAERSRSAGPTTCLLDETALGRQEEEPKGRVQSARAARPDFAS
jgi:hypothetical protein